MVLLSEDPGRVVIYPSIAASTPDRWRDALLQSVSAGVDGFHLDLTDGVFAAPGFLDLASVAEIRALTALPLDVHLMVRSPAVWVPPLLEIGVDRILLHVESHNPLFWAGRIRGAGVSYGACLLPGTPLDSVKPHVPIADAILPLSVSPGRSGQSMAVDAVQRLEGLRSLVQSARPRMIQLIADGGVIPQNARALCESGASLLVSGAWVFSGGGPIEDQVRSLRCTARLA